MLKVQKKLFQLLWVVLVSVYLSTVVYMTLKGVMVAILLVIIVMPFYGLYRSIKGQEVTKGLKYYLLPLFNFLRKLFRIKYFNLTSLVIIGIVAINIFKGLVCIFVYTLVALSMHYVIWGVARCALKRLNFIEIPRFREVIWLAL